ncbi:hypothetical protein K443DRAFT_377342 [Laccaria amethystina LaAM-08-1]|uniref:Uncharacterized protein n=1 Tax=Laccaria amethystina LaAM-08-1 TaxID=1095629 RepID=A0A0C9XC78_9AGAR|nr:hypothetical protein K443DRAFT_377342 [Laccaria amethystina LaAM-08-1]
MPVAAERDVRRATENQLGAFMCCLTNGRRSWECWKLGRKKTNPRGEECAIDVQRNVEEVEVMPPAFK